MTTKEEYPTVTVSGRFSPASRSDSYPSSIGFSNITTGQRYMAVATNGEYSVQLPTASHTRQPCPGSPSQASGPAPRRLER